jgi:hypothetical protein
MLAKPHNAPCLPWSCRAVNLRLAWKKPTARNPQRKILPKQHETVERRFLHLNNLSLIQKVKRITGKLRCRLRLATTVIHA